MDKLNDKMIVLARESRGLTQTELSKLLEIPQGNLSRIERGDVGLTEQNLENLSKVLNYPKEFFFQTNKICIPDTHYRKAAILDQKTKLKAEAIMNIYMFNIDAMLKDLDIPTNNIPIMRDQYDSPEKIAQYVRSYWNIGKGPIYNLSKIIEDNGIVIVHIDFETDKIDGRTIFSNTGHPIIFINKNASGDRQRLTLAHELGHLILHSNTMPVFGRDEEPEAFNFGIEFLMPLSECKYDLTGNLTLERLADLKRVWKVAMQAILYRVQEKDILTYNKCRYLWAQINARGWRKSEPIIIPQEKPTLLGRMISMLTEGKYEIGYSKKDLSVIFKLSEEELEERYFKNTGKLRVA